jgi:hypothetical protein
VDVACGSRCRLVGVHTNTRAIVTDSGAVLCRCSVRFTDDANMGTEKLNEAKLKLGPGVPRVRLWLEVGHKGRVDRGSMMDVTFNFKGQRLSA